MIDALVDKEMLLVVDNCEQVLAAGLDLTEPLRACPGIRLLVTSRERLHLAAEREFPVGPLAVPQLRRRRRSRPPGRGARGRDARRAGALRAARLRGDRAANAQAVAEICQRLDGLPLALELAAARAKLFTPAELADRLRDRMAVLTTNARDAPARHRTLRAALEWSYDLLAEHERTLFRRLSVFVGAWTLDAAEQVCGDRDTDVLDVVGSLLDKSLVRRPTQGGVAEFVLLESLREYAAELLAADGDAGRDPRPARRPLHRGRRRDGGRHRAARRVRVVERRDGLGRGEPPLRVGAQPRRRAHGAGAAPRRGAGVALLLPRHLGTGRARLARTLEACASAAPDDALAAAVVAAGVLAWSVGDLGAAHDPPAARLGDQRGAAATGAGRRWPARSSGTSPAPRAGSPTPRPTTSTPPSSTRRSRASPATRGRATTSACSPCGGATARPRSASCRDGLTLFRRLDYDWAIGRCAWALAAAHLHDRALDEASALLVEALDRHRAVGDGRGLAQCLETAGGVLGARGRGDAAARLLGAAAECRRRLAAPLPDEDRDDHDAALHAVRRRPRAGHAPTRPWPRAASCGPTMRPRSPARRSQEPDPDPAPGHLRCAPPRRDRAAG